MRDFDLLKVLGTGAYGKVFLVRKLTGHDKGKLYAMKVLRKEVVAQKTKTLDHTRTERKVLEAIRNEPFLVTMHYAFQTKTKLHLILDYVNGGELFTHLYQRDHFREDDVKIYIGELILALEKLHKVSSTSAYIFKFRGNHIRALNYFSPPWKAQQVYAPLMVVYCVRRIARGDPLCTLKGAAGCHFVSESASLRPQRMQ